MNYMSRKCTALISVMAIFMFTSLPIVSGEMSQEKNQGHDETEPRSEDKENALDVARIKLGHAFDAYRKADVDSTKRNLNAANQWLRKAEKSSTTDKAKDEVRALAVEIEAFKATLHQSSKQKENDLARFWHRATSIIKREAEQLIHSYVTLSSSEKTLKHLLDAKMHIFTAEHDLFVSHNAEDASEELGKALEYLTEATQSARPAIREKVILLQNDLQLLRENISTSEKNWNNDLAIHALNKSLKSLIIANENISPDLKLRVDNIKTNIRILRADIASSNVKNKYESAMARLQNIINEL